MITSALTMCGDHGHRSGKNRSAVPKVGARLVFPCRIVVLCGILTFIRTALIERSSRLAYTGFDAGLGLMAAVSIVLLLLRLAAAIEDREPGLRNLR